MSTIFFTDGVLAHRISCAEGDLTEYVVPPESRIVLETLRERGIRTGVIVNLGNQTQKSVEVAVNRSDLSSFFDAGVVVYAHGRIRQALDEALMKVGPDPSRRFFVGEHCDERALALQTGFAGAIPHPSLALEVQSGGLLVYARVSKLDGKSKRERIKSLLALPLVPLHLASEEQGSLYVITSTRAVDAIRDAGFNVRTYGSKHDPQTTDAYLAYDDRPVPQGINAATYATEYLARRGKKRFVLGYTGEALLLALPPDSSIEKIHFPNALHGHNRRLLPDPSLLDLAAELTHAVSTRPPLTTKANTTLSEKEIDALREGITSETLKRLHAPYVGDVPLDDSGQVVVKSRHIAHAHNAPVTEALCKHLKQIGGDLMSVQRHDFTLGGETFSNVEAELPGTQADSFILLSAHFDSTGRSDKYFKPNQDPAPGADDDASGVAAVLAAAEVAIKLRAAGVKLKRTLRFVLFNAEEDYILGSEEYAACQSALKADISAVFQMDMIGFSGGASRDFEVHVKFAANSDTEKRSLALSRTISDMVAVVSPLLDKPQIYSSAEGYDPAEGRSDHTHFQRKGYRACMISEDYCTDEGDPSPDPHSNPVYHTKKDKKIDYVYAAEIARAVVAAAFLTAKS